MAFLDEVEQLERLLVLRNPGREVAELGWLIDS